LIPDHESQKWRKIPAEKPLTFSDVAWDSGQGIDRVEISSDGDKSWLSTKLGEDFGCFAFRPFDFTTSVLAAGGHIFMVRPATRIVRFNLAAPIPNPAGNHYNAIQSLTLIAA